MSEIEIEDRKRKVCNNYNKLISRDLSHYKMLKTEAELFKEANPSLRKQIFERIFRIDCIIKIIDAIRKVIGKSYYAIENTRKFERLTENRQTLSNCLHFLFSEFNNWIDDNKTFCEVVHDEAEASCAICIRPKELKYLSAEKEKYQADYCFSIHGSLIKVISKIGQTNIAKLIKTLERTLSSGLTKCSQKLSDQLITVTATCQKRTRRSVKKKTNEESLSLVGVNYYRTTELPKKFTPLALDVEKVQNRETKQMLGAWVALVQHKHNRRGKNGSNVVYQAIINYPEKEVNRMYHWSGIGRWMLGNGIELKRVQDDLKYFLDNYKIIGVDIKQDLRSLGLESYASRCIDIQTSEGFYIGRNNMSLSLKDLVHTIIGKEIQKNNGCGHSPIIDARFTLKLYYFRVKGISQPKADKDGHHNFEYCRRLKMQ